MVKKPKVALPIDFKYRSPEKSPPPVPLTQYLEPGFKRAGSRRIRYIRKGCAQQRLKGARPKQSLLVQRIMSLTNTAGCKLLEILTFYHRGFP